MTTETEPLRMWTVYNSPTDFPGKYVARLHLNDEPQQSHVASENIETIRDLMRSLQLFRIERSPDDEPHIMEVWL